MTVIVGVWYNIKKATRAMGNLQTKCGGDFPGPTDCNLHWRSVFTLNPVILLDIWTPLIVGIIAMGLTCQKFKVVESIKVDTWFKFCGFQVFMAFFANFGYTGKLGVWFGF